MNKQLHITKEESDYTTSRSCWGTSNIDVTVISNQLLRAVFEWEISDKESCSHHSTIRYAIGQGRGHRSEFYFQDVRYIVQKGNIENFQENLLWLAKKKLCKLNKEGDRRVG